MLICVAGEASGVPGSGEIVGRAASAPAGNARAAAATAVTPDMVRRRLRVRRQIGTPAPVCISLRIEHMIRPRVPDYDRLVSSAERGTRDSGDPQRARREIIAASDRFLRERPYRELTVEVVTTDIGVTEAEFNEHFEDITEVVLMLLTEMGNELYGVAERWLQDAQIEQQAELGFNTAARVWLRAIVDFFYRNGTIVRTLSEAAFTDARIERAYNGFLDRFTELTAFGLEQWSRRGGSRRSTRGPSPRR